MVDGILLIYKVLKIFQKKIKSFAHGEFNKEHLSDKKN